MIFVRKHGEFVPVKDEAGKLKYMMQFPQVAIAQKALGSLLRYQQEFGLTPSSRSAIVAAPRRLSAQLEFDLADRPERFDCGPPPLTCNAG